MYKVIGTPKKGHRGFTSGQIGYIADEIISFVNINHVNLYINDPDFKKYANYVNKKRKRAPKDYSKYKVIQSRDVIRININSFSMCIYATAYSIRQVLERLDIKITEV